MSQFPKDFLWGAATSAHQVEGNNTNSDWWEWEKSVGKVQSGPACRHYELFKEDFDLAKLLNHNAHRLSVEWSRIEPQEGQFSEQELNHYKEVISALRERNIEPIVTLHHFTNPVWFLKLGGWTSKDAQKYFLRFCDKIVDHLCGGVSFWVTINEPTIYTYYSYIVGDWPPQEKSIPKAKAVMNNFFLAHVGSYRLIHDIYKKNNLNPPYVSFTQNVQAFVACTPSWKNKLSVFLKDKIFNFGLIEKLARKKCLDFIGVNYYSRSLVDIEGFSPKNILSGVCSKNHSKLKKNSMGWDIYPKGLYDLLIKLKKYNLPVFILENGICTEDDSLRWEFIREHLLSMSKAMDEGSQVLGYIYWSLLDNFEWDKGFTPRFGLVEMDYNTFKRSVRESAKKFAEVCKTGII